MDRENKVKKTGYDKYKNKRRIGMFFQDRDHWAEIHDERYRERVKNGEIPLATSDDPLFLAVQKGDVGTTFMLLNDGSDVNVRDKDGRTPLMIAFMARPCHCSLHYADEMNQLWRFGADDKSEDNYGRTVLHYACGSGDGNAVRNIVERGGDINAIDSEGRTPLMYLVFSWSALDPYLVHDFLLMGADPTIETYAGFPLWDFMEQSFEPALLYESSNVRYQSRGDQNVSMKASKVTEPESSVQALEKGSDVSVHRQRGKTAVVQASDPVYRTNCLAPYKKTPGNI